MGRYGSWYDYIIHLAVIGSLWIFQPSLSLLLCFLKSIKEPSMSAVEHMNFTDILLGAIYVYVYLYIYIVM